MKKILVFGNPLLKEDSLPLRILKNLRKEFPDIEFEEFDTADDLQNEGRNLVILDTVKGIKKVMIIKDIKSIITDKIYSLHDFDLGYALKLLKKMKMIDSVKIIGVPDKIKEKDAIKQLKEIISSVFSEND